jgi:UPF0755 protein
MKKVLIGSLLVILLVSGLAGWAFYDFLTKPGPALDQTVIISIPEGMTFRSATQTLIAEGLLKNEPLFLLWAKVTGADRKIKSGEYEVSTALSPLELLHILTEGQTLQRVVTIPEGLTFRQIAKILASKELGAEESFLCLNTDPEFLAQWGLPPQGMEGYLYPDTYYFSRSVSPEEILGRMINRFYEALSPALYRQADLLGFSLHDALTLASLVEKETGNEAERPLISAVLHNRLRKGMLLQCDPTVIYGLGDDFDGNLTRQHLLTPTPYNTYVIRGLPPGPIANPGIKSITAAVQRFQRGQS